MANKRKKTEPMEHMQIDYPPLRNLVWGRETPYDPKLVLLKQEDDASVGHPGIEFVADPTSIQSLQRVEGWCGGRLWALPIGPIPPFISGLHFLCTMGPENNERASIQWYESPHLPGVQAVRLNEVKKIVADLGCVDLDDFIRKLKSYNFEVHHQKSEEFEVVDFWNAAFNMNTLMGLESIQKLPTDEKQIREKLQGIENRFKGVHDSIEDMKGDGSLISQSLYNGMSGLQITLEDIKEDVRGVKNSIYEA